jgi:ATP-dependent protease ClpP protease subunit
MTRQAIVVTLLLGICVGGAFGDTFRHRQTGEKFDGFLTQKHDQSKTLVYVEKDKAFKALNLGEYEVTRNDLGRRNSVVVIPIRTEECLISQEVSRTVADTIIDASNKGPRYIVLEIDCPGGYGEYMKYICATVTDTTNCPVVAYISGGKYGGAYSAAAAIALAAEKIYIAGDAAMGSVAPLVGSPGITGPADDYYEKYSSDSLSGFRTYVSAIASNRSRPVTLAMALVDKSMEIQEVEDQNGNRRYVGKDDRTPQESIVRTVSKVETRTVAAQGQDAGKREISTMVVTVTADEAYKAKLVDKVVATRDDMLRDLGVADAQVTYNRGIETAVRKFLATRRNVEQSLIQIDFLQQRVDDLKKQFDRLGEEVRTSPTTTERSYGDGYGSDSFRERRYSDRSYGNGRYGDRYGTPRERQRVSGVAPPAGAYALAQELGVGVANLIREYRRAMGLAQRDPGALPVGVTVGLLQRRHDEAVALQNSLFSRF